MIDKFLVIVAIIILSIWVDITIWRTISPKDTRLSTRVLKALFMIPYAGVELLLIVILW